MAQELKARKEMDPRFQWRLEDIFATGEAYEKAYAEAERAIAAMAGWQGRVKENPRQAILDADAISLRLDHLAAYALMHKDEDGADPERQARAMRFQTLGVKAGSAMAFLESSTFTTVTLSGTFTGSSATITPAPFSATSGAYR